MHKFTTIQIIILKEREKAEKEDVLLCVWPNPMYNGYTLLSMLTAGYRCRHRMYFNIVYNNQRTTDPEFNQWPKKEKKGREKEIERDGNNGTSN